jgi:hypothetical protein
MSGEDIEKKSESKNIPVEKLEKIVNKIKNGIIHNMTLMYDLSHKYDPDEFAEKEEDIEIEEVKVEDNKLDTSQEFFRSDSMMSENLQKQTSQSSIMSDTKKSESRVDAFKREYKPLVDKRKFYF